MSKQTEIICDNKDCGARKGPNDRWIYALLNDPKKEQAQLKISWQEFIGYPAKDYCSIQCLNTAIEEFLMGSTITTKDLEEEMDHYREVGMKFGV